MRQIKIVALQLLQEPLPIWMAGAERPSDAEFAEIRAMQDRFFAELIGKELDINELERIYNRESPCCK